MRRGHAVTGRGLSEILATIVSRDEPELSHGVERVRLNLEPDAEFRFRRPDRRRSGAGVARYGHAASPRASAAALRIAAMLAW